jgi:hypothetical protein
MVTQAEFDAAYDNALKLKGGSQKDQLEVSLTIEFHKLDISEGYELELIYDSLFVALRLGQNRQSQGGH